MSTKAKTAPPETDKEDEAGGGKKKILILALIVVVGAAAAWWFMLKPASGEPAAPKAGEVVALDPIQINLADGHYLSVGIALQTVEGTEEVDGSKALDATIELFSGSSIDDLLKPKNREHLKDELQGELGHLYDDEVMAVYFTQFVTQ